MKSQMERNCFGKTVRKYYSLQIHALPPIVEAAYLPNLNRNTEEKNSPAMKIDLVIDTDTKIFQRIKIRIIKYQLSIHNCSKTRRKILPTSFSNVHTDSKNSNYFNSLKIMSYEQTYKSTGRLLSFLIMFRFCGAIRISEIINGECELGSRIKQKIQPNLQIVRHR